MLYAVFELEGSEWYFKKAFTTEDAANDFVWLHSQLNIKLKVVPYKEDV